MEKVVKKFSSFEEADEADYEYYRDLSPDERLAIFCELLSLVKDADESTSPRMERFFRIARLGES